MLAYYIKIDDIYQFKKILNFLLNFKIFLFSLYTFNTKNYFIIINKLSTVFIKLFLFHVF